jgi:hypothetical protein
MLALGHAGTATAAFAVDLFEADNLAHRGSSRSSRGLSSIRV